MRWHFFFLQVCTFFAIHYELFCNSDSVYSKEIASFALPQITEHFYCRFFAAICYTFLNPLRSNFYLQFSSHKNGYTRNTTQSIRKEIQQCSTTPALIYLRRSNKCGQLVCFFLSLTDNTYFNFALVQNGFSP